MQGTKRLWIVVVLLGMPVVLYLNCDLNRGDRATRIMGVVTDSLTGSAIDSAVIQLSDTVGTLPFYSDSLGRYMALTFGYGLHRVYCRNEGYRSQSRVVGSSESHATLAGVDFHLSSE